MKLITIDRLLSLNMSKLCRVYGDGITMQCSLMCSWLKPMDFNCWTILERDGHESQVLELELFVHELKVHSLDAFCESSPKSEGIDTYRCPDDSQVPGWF